MKRQFLLIIIILALYTQKVNAQISGIDIHDNTITSWANVANPNLGGIQFAYIKATESTYAPYTNFPVNASAAKGVNITVGAYHFATPLFSPGYYQSDYVNQSTVSQEATNFINAAYTSHQYIGNGFLPPALDVEDQIVSFSPSNGYPANVYVNILTGEKYYYQYNPTTQTTQKIELTPEQVFMIPATLAQWIHDWSTAVLSQTGIMPILYCNKTYAALLYPSYLNGTITNKLWIADWSSPEGSPETTPWPNWPWVFQQYNGTTGTVSGISGTVDLDVFNGDMTAFNNLIGATAVQAPPNDNCSAATLLTSSASINYLSNQTVNNATPSTFPKAVNDLYTGTPSLDDVWYSFQATGTSTTITVNPTGTSASGLDAIIAAYNSCTNSTEINSSDTPGGPGALSTLTIPTTPGNLYYIRVYDYGAINTTDGGFEIAVTSTATSEPDLIVQNPQVTPSSVGMGQQVTASCSNYNQGNGSAGTSYTAIWLCPTQQYVGAPTDLYIDEIAVPSLASGVSSGVLSKQIIIPSGPYAGTWYIMFGADAAGTVTESDETNNQVFVPITFNNLSSDANLSSLAISDGTLSPSFTPGTTNYSVAVSNSISQITFTPTVENSSATLTVNNLAVNSGSVSQGIFLNVGTNTIPIIVYAQDGTPKTYNITITRAPSSDANLSNLLISNGTLTPSFSPGTNNYSISVGNDVSQINFTPTLENNTASLTVNGLPVASSSTSQGIFLNIGINTIPITVTAQDETTNTYYIAVTRAPSSDANLSNLLISNGTLTPSFSPGTNNYSISVGNDVSQINFTPTLENNTASLTVNGLPVASSSTSQGIFLNVGINTIPITVTAQDETTNTYYIAVTRAPSSDANLSNLLISDGTLTPSFSPGTNNYSISVGNAVSQINFTPTLENNTASLTVNGLPVASSSTSQGIFLNVGINTIPITVTAQDETTNTYYIAVTRAPSSDANLSNLLVSNGTLSPSFVPGISNYSVSVSNNISSMTVTPTVENNTATITVNGIAVLSGAASNAIVLGVGVSTITTVVTAQDGITTVTYTITVTRTPLTNALLSTIKLTPASTLTNTGTVSGTTTYTTTAAGGTTSVTVTPTAQDATATIKVNGVPVTSGTASGSIALAPGATTAVNTVVTAQDGITTHTYSIIVTRLSNNALLSIIKLTPASALTDTGTVGSTKTYTTLVPNATASVTITPTAKDPTATIKVNGIAVMSGTASGAIALPVGETIINTLVTAQDGVTTHTYSIKVFRAQSANALLSIIKLTPASTLTNTGTTSTTTTYTTTAAGATASVTVTPTTQDATATIKVNGVTVASGTASASIALAAGTTTTINTVVTAQDGTTTHTYSIVVTRLSNNASLSTIKLTPASALTNTGTSGTTTTYTTTAAAGTTSVTVTPTAQDPTATIKVNGVAVTSGTASGPIAIAVGKTTITIVATAQNGTTTRTYSIIVTRTASSNALLSTIKLTPASALTNTGTTGTTTTYTTSVSNATTSVTVTATSQDANAKIKVNGVAVTSGTASGSIALTVGQTTITTIVTAQDGTTTHTFSITVTRATGPLHSLYMPVSVVQPQENLNIESDGVLVHQGVSPNGDGLNDFLTIDGIIAYPDNSLQIIDRNGTLIYQAKGYNNITKVFDGHSGINGRMQQPGTYFYSLDYIADGQTKHKTGFIILKY